MVQNALTVGEEALQIVLGGVDVPDPIQLTTTLRRIGFRAWNEIDEHMAAAARIREREGVVSKNATSSGGESASAIMPRQVLGGQQSLAARHLRLDSSANTWARIVAFTASNMAWHAGWRFRYYSMGNLLNDTDLSSRQLFTRRPMFLDGAELVTA